MSFFKRQIGVAVYVASLVSFNGPSAASPDVAAICDSAAMIAARETNVPLDVLRAIALTETGRTSDAGFLPWPWTVNMEGAGKWFDDVASAQRYVDRHFSRGARSFDVGCFQINYRWHGDAFNSVEEMFDPLANARYAARFLSELYDEFGNWSKAAGAYHSRTPKFARRYTARFDRIRADLPVAYEVDYVMAAQVPPREPAPVPERPNQYPFLFAAAPSRGASLVPLSDQSRSPFSARERRPLLEMR